MESISFGIQAYKPAKTGQLQKKAGAVNALKRLLLAAAMSWFFAVTLGLLFAACVGEHFSFSTLLLPGVVPVALIASSEVAILIAPIALWSVRTGARNLRIYAPILWIALAIYIVAVTLTYGAYYGINGSMLLGGIGSVLLGFIPVEPSKTSS